MSTDANDRDASLLKVKSDAMRLVSFQPRSVSELRTRLKEKKHDEMLINEVIALLEKQGLLNDEKFAKLFAGSRMLSKPSGKRLIERDLRKKGLSDSVIKKTLAGAGDYDEKKAARDLVYARFHKMTGVSTDKKRARLFGFLNRRGFAAGTIFSVLSELFKEEQLQNLGGHDDD